MSPTLTTPQAKPVARDKELTHAVQCEFLSNFFFYTFYEDDMLSSKIILIFFDWDYLLHKLSINFLLSLNMES
jgi:hypothetical protein